MATDPENTGNHEEPSSKNTETEESRTDMADNNTQSTEKVIFNKRTVGKLSIVNCIVALASISLGVAVIIEGEEMSHWVAKSAFGVWFGLLVFTSAISGSLAASKATSRTRALFLTTLNIWLLILSLISMGFYGEAATFYKKMIDVEDFPGCVKGPTSTISPTQDYKKCKHEHKNKAILLTSIFSVLIIVSIVELIVSFLLLILTRKSLHCCYECCVVDYGNNMHAEQFSMYYTGCSYGPSFGGDAPYLEYSIDQRPLRPQPRNKQIPMKSTTNFRYHKCNSSQRSKKPHFLAMESINESQEANANEEKENLTAKEQEKLGEVSGFL